jgi:tRNA A37 threonylcarbamoyladenosine synthetase subunit TsaC/SUA5/YrdC
MTARYLSIHPDDPQPRLLAQAVEVVRDDGIVALPTDSCYALGCRLGDKEAVERIRHIRGLDTRHHLTLMCRDLSEIAQFAREQCSIPFAQEEGLQVITCDNPVTSAE